MLHELHLTSIQIPVLGSQPHSDYVSPPSMSIHVYIRISTSSKSCLTSIQVRKLTSHPHPCPRICITTPSKSCLASSQVPSFASQPYRGSVSPIFRHLYWSLTPIQLPMGTSSHHPGHISPLSVLQDLHSNPDLGSIWAPSGYRNVWLNSIQVSSIASLA